MNWSLMEAYCNGNKVTICTHDRSAPVWLEGLVQRALELHLAALLS